VNYSDLEYKVFYSFLHVNEAPVLASGYRLYRQDGIDANYNLIKTIPATEVSVDSQPIEITGMDVVKGCDVVFN